MAGLIGVWSLGVSGAAAGSWGAWFERVVQWSARGVELAGIGVLVVGLVVATVLFLWRLRGGQAFQEAYHRYRGNLGRSILLGLEFLVAADIIATVVVAPTFRTVGVLGLIVLIRTFLSFSLEVEIEGHWPWNASKRSGEQRG